jgi:hypothetical protein
VGARLTFALRSLWKYLGEGLMWVGLAYGGLGPSSEWYEWRDSRTPPVRRPCHPVLSEREHAEWAALVKQLRKAQHTPEEAV